VGPYALYIYEVPGLALGLKQVIRHEYRQSVTWSSLTLPMAWGRGNSTTGWPLFNSNENSFNTGWCDVVPGTLTSTRCTLRTYLYQVYSIQGQFLGWYPTSPGNAVFAYTARSTLAAPTTDPDVAQSYFVPQADSTVNPTEGTAAIQYFRTCPNNDGTQTLPHNARLKVVLRNSAGAPIVGVQATEIFALFNGGSAAQGFSGAGADSIIANSEFNSSPACPDVRALEADAATDANGVAYITLKGATPGKPGTATRDPLRKWGHYDSEMPVYVRGIKLQGRLTTGSANGTYQLEIKTFDLLDGLGTGVNQGEAVTASDYNDVVAHNNQADSADPGNWWRDFDNSGIVNSIDINFIGAHVNHGCNSPNNP